jgi:hypothetical protein
MVLAWLFIKRYKNPVVFDKDNGLFELCSHVS